MGGKIGRKMSKLQIWRPKWQTGSQNGVPKVFEGSSNLFDKFLAPFWRQDGAKCHKHAFNIKLARKTLLSRAVHPQFGWESLARSTHVNKHFDLQDIPTKENDIGAPASLAHTILTKSSYPAPLQTTLHTETEITDPQMSMSRTSCSGTQTYNDGAGSALHVASLVQKLKSLSSVSQVSFSIYMYDLSEKNKCFRILLVLGAHTNTNSNIFRDCTSFM